MGKAHSNAYAQVGPLLRPSVSRPAHVAVRPRPDLARLDGGSLGLGETRHRLARRHRPSRHRHRRHRPAESSACAGGHRRRRSGQDRLLREAAGAVGRGRSRDGRGGARPSHAGVVQLPARARHCLRASADRTTAGSGRFTTTTRRTGSSGVPDTSRDGDLEDGSGAGRIGRGGRSAHAPSRYGAVPERSESRRGSPTREPSCRTVESTMR